MKYKFLLFFTLFIVNDVSAQWQTIFKDSTNFWCTNVLFLNNDTGFVSAAWLTSTTYSGAIFKTYDGGQSWDTTAFIPAIYSIQFINDSVGFAGGQDGAIYRTDNMGASWNWILGGPCCSDLFSLHFFDADTGIYAKSFYDILQTTNGGPDWQSVFQSLGWTSYPGRSRIIFTDSMTGYITQSTITKTTDRGATWFNLNLPLDFYACSAHFFDSNTGISVGYDGKVTKTVDGGLTWSAPDSLGAYPLSDIIFINDSIGYIVGGKDNYNYPSTNGIIYKTINGGSSWQVMDSSYFDGLLKMYFPSDSIGYAVGINGIVLKISSANATGIEENQILLDSQDFWIQTNPVSTTLFITFNSIENITIFDLYGNTILARDNLPKQDKSLEIDISSLASGIYVIKSAHKALKFLKL